MALNKKLIVVLAAALVLAAAGIALGIWMQRDGVATTLESDARRAEADAPAVPAGQVRQAQPLYYSFDPDIVLNIKDTDAVIDAGVSLSTHDAATRDALKNDDPALRSAILMALADMPQDTAMSDAGKVQMLARLVTAVNRQLQIDGYRGTVDGAYFTSFVVGGGDTQ